MSPYLTMTISIGLNKKIAKLKTGLKMSNKARRL
jgi:hypothetical protein